MSEFDGEGVAQAAEAMIWGSTTWQHISKHNAAVQSLYLGALWSLSAYSQPSIACETEAHSDLTHCLNALGRLLFPSVHWTCIQVNRWGKGTDPMLTHTHKNDESASSAILCFGDFSGGEFFSQGITSSSHLPAPVCTFHEGSLCTALRWPQGKG